MQEYIHTANSLLWYHIICMLLYVDQSRLEVWINRAMLVIYICTVNYFWSGGSILWSYIYIILRDEAVDAQVIVGHLPEKPQSSEVSVFLCAYNGVS